MSETVNYARFRNKARYADLWKLLKRLGYDCGWLGTHPLGGFTVRMCKHSSSRSNITLTDEPPDQFVDPLSLIGVRLQLDNFGIMDPEAFDRWTERRAKANAAKDNAAKDTNGTGGAKRARKSRAPRGEA